MTYAIHFKGVSKIWCQQTKLSVNLLSSSLTIKTTRHSLL